MKKRKILARPDPESNQSLHGAIGSSPQRQDNVQLPNLVGNDRQIMADEEDEGGANEPAQSGQIYAPEFKMLEEEHSVKHERQEPVPPPNDQSQGGTYGQQEEQDGSGTQQEEQGQPNECWSDCGWDSDKMPGRFP